MAVADEIAAKESLQVQQQSPQPVNSVTKDSFSTSSRGYTGLQFGSRQGARQPSNLSQATSYTCFSCGSPDHLKCPCDQKNYFLFSFRF